jgi:hypothetical protein
MCGGHTGWYASFASFVASAPTALKRELPALENTPSFCVGDCFGPTPARTTPPDTAVHAAHTRARVSQRSNRVCGSKT